MVEKGSTILPIDYRELSRTVSHALRHSPAEYGLATDAQGWVTIGDLLAALRGRKPEWQSLAEADLGEMIRRSDKARHQMDESRIRAAYGHSSETKIQREPKLPPEVLFHGTDPAAVEIIRGSGLSPMARQQVHLSADRETAELVGRRKAPAPVILRIDAGRAHRSGISFYQGNDSVWLADSVPPEFIFVDTHGT